jgi:Pterin 4 alpha carbinolamine dehydratase
LAPAAAERRTRSHATPGRHRGAEGLRGLPGWERRGSQIVKSLVREDFAHAMVFVNEVAAAAEAAAITPTSTFALPCRVADRPALQRCRPGR